MPAIRPIPSVLWVLLFVPPAGAASFSFETLVADARRLAAKPYAEAGRTPPYYLKLSYDDFRKIRYRPERTIWNERPSPAGLQLFHQGLFFDRCVEVGLLEDGTVTPVDYDKTRFDFGGLVPPSGTPEPSGYAGLRWHGEADRSGDREEFSVFAGATYFRCRPAGDSGYGVSARALAVDPGMKDIAEDFPFFRRVIAEKPAPGTRSVVTYALMDSPNVCGAFRLETTPGRIATTQVDAVIVARRPGLRLGLAPFSSMFWFGENTRRQGVDFRPEVHDSDGVSIVFPDGRHRWRPLVNDGVSIRRSVLASGRVSSFGLRQRDTAYASYKDIGARYHARPGATIIPGAGWPEGELELLELPTGEEYWDNIVLYWRPKTPPVPGTPRRFAYTVRWGLECDLIAAGDPARVLETMVAPKEKTAGVTRFVVDWERLPGDPPGKPARFPDLKAEVVAPAVLQQAEVHYNPETDGWRGVIDAAIPAGVDRTVTARLEREGRAISEEWCYRPEKTEAVKK